MYNIPCAFDIETSSFTINGEKAACMYVWMMDINDVIIIGRTWSEWCDFLENISDIFECEYGQRHLIIYVHNLSYEFQFIRKWLKWKDVFATEARKVLKAVTVSGIEFRCSYLLSGYSLDYIGKHLVKGGTLKKTGDLDYQQVRHSQTLLTDKELGYCINDVRVVVDYIRQCIERDGDIRYIQLTKTGYVRKFTRDKCLDKKSAFKFRRLIKNMTLSVDDYQQAVRAFHGGFTHASCRFVGKLLSNVGSYDIASSYPSVMCAEPRFPISKATYLGALTFDEYLKYSEKYAVVCDMTFYDIESKNDIDHPLSSSKCWGLAGALCDNGRVVYADQLSTSLTEIDFEIYNKFYNWGSLEITNARAFIRGYLPKPIIESVLELFAKKTSLKGVDGMEVEYMQAKEYINSEYGQTVTAVCRDEIVYTDEWTTVPGNMQEQLDRYNTSYKRVLYYYWGIYITALAMRNLFWLIEEAGEDYVYSDTDSVKMLNPDKHRKAVEEYNDRVKKKLFVMCEHFNIDKEMVTPRTIKGEVKMLGVFEWEGEYTRFKTLGAKRYMVEKPDALKVEKEGKTVKYDISLTVSGVNKTVAIPWLKKAYKSNDKIFRAFNDGLCFPPEATGKLTHTYCDNDMWGTVTDYQGTPGEFYEKSYIHLEPTGYDLSMLSAFVNYLKGVQEKIE